MKIQPVDYGKNEQSLIFWVKYQKARCKLECFFETGEGQIKQMNRNLTYEKYKVIKAKLYERFDFILNDKEKVINKILKNE